MREKIPDPEFRPPTPSHIPTKRRIYERRFGISFFGFFLLLVFGIWDLGSPRRSWAAPAGTAGTTSGTFLRTARPARAAAMGDVVAAVDRGVWGAWGNPAGVVRLARRQLGLSRIESFADISVNMIGYAQPVTDREAMAISYTHVGFGAIDGRDNTGLSTGNIRASSDAVGFTWAYRYTENFAVGATARYVLERLDDRTADAITMDIGATWRTPIKGLDFGVAGQNLFGKLKFQSEAFSLPRTVRIGMAQRLMSDRILLAVDAVKGLDTDWEVGGGTEISITRFLSLRAGARSTQTDDLDVSLGMGITSQRFTIDYGFIPSTTLGDQHRVSLTAEF